MIGLKKSISDALGKIPRIKPKKSTEVDARTGLPKKTRHKKSWKAKLTPSVLERTPAKDTVEISSKRADTPKKSARTEKTNLGDIFTANKRALARAYLNDLEDVAQMIPEATFFREVNSETSVKKISSIIEKLAKREEKYSERGYKEVIRDEIRARMFLPDADKNYEKVIDAMKKKKYKVATTYEEDANGNLILDESGKAKKIPDIDVRFGEKAQPSGYQDVQIRFEKGDMLYELILMPGPHYLSAANKEHDIYDQFKRYDSLGITKDIGAKQIVKAIKKEFGKVTKKLYDSAEQRDRFGSAQIAETVTFSPEEYKTLQGLFGSLKSLFMGKFNGLPPSKKTVAEFKDTKTAQNLNSIEQKLRGFMDLFKPVENKKTEA